MNKKRYYVYEWSDDSGEFSVCLETDRTGTHFVIADCDGQEPEENKKNAEMICNALNQQETA